MLRTHLLAIFIFAFSPNLHAAACCTSATAFGTGRLLLWESWAAGIRSQVTHELGFFDDERRYEPNPSNEIDQQIRFDAYSIFALSEDASVFVVIPWVLPRVSSSTGVQMGSNLSDLQLGYRHQIIAIGEYEELPSLALTASALFPTGTARSLETAPQNVTGRGLYALMAGASLEKTWMPFFAQLNLGATLFSDYVPSYQIALASGMELTTGLVLSTLGQWVYESPSKYRTQFGIAMSWRFNQHLTAQANINTDVFAHGFGANWPGALSYGFGLRYGYF